MRTIEIHQMNRMCNAIMQLGYEPAQAKIAVATMSRLVNKQGFQFGSPEHVAWARREIGDDRIVTAATEALSA